MARRGAHVVVVFTIALFFALAWRHELYLIVVVLPAAATTLLAQSRLADRADARRAAALALVAPAGVSDASAIERIVTADLAAASLGDRAVLDHAISRAERSVADAYQRALACERLEAAKYVFVGAAFDVPEALVLLRRAHVRVLTVAATALVLLAVVATQHKLLLGPLALTCAATTLAAGEVRRADQLQRLLVQQATTEPATGRVLVPDAAIVWTIERLTSGRPRVALMARSVISDWPGLERANAVRRLGTTPATRIPAMSAVGRDIVACVIAAAALIAAFEAM